MSVGNGKNLNGRGFFLIDHKKRETTERELTSMMLLCWPTSWRLADPLKGVGHLPGKTCSSRFAALKIPFNRG